MEPQGRVTATDVWQGAADLEALEELGVDESGLTLPQPGLPDWLLEAWIDVDHAVRSPVAQSLSCPPERQSQSVTQRLLLGAAQAGFEMPSRIHPTAVGGIAVRWHRGAKRVLFECYNDGRLGLLLANRRIGFAKAYGYSAEDLDNGIQEALATVRKWLAEGLER